MNNKKYITPSIEVVKIGNTQIMAGSTNARIGDDTDVQYSKKFQGFCDEFEDDEE